jgi:hypothetical protein
MENFLLGYARAADLPRFGLNQSSKLVDRTLVKEAVDGAKDLSFRERSCETPRRTGSPQRHKLPIGSRHRSVKIKHTTVVADGLGVFPKSVFFGGQIKVSKLFHRAPPVIGLTASATGAPDFDLKLAGSNSTWVPGTRPTRPTTFEIWAKYSTPSVKSWINP